MGASGDCAVPWTSGKGAAWKHDSPGLLQINKGSNEGVTPLYAACVHGHSEVVMALMASDALQVNTVGELGFTPLHVACENNHAETVKVLPSCVCLLLGLRLETLVGVDSYVEQRGGVQGWSR